MAELHYAILRHEGIEHPHFDLMFETTPGSKLATWRSDAWPINGVAPVDHLPDHRAEYLTYEGPVSGDRGNVSRVASGTCLITRTTPLHWVVRLLPAGPWLVLRAIEGDRWEIAPGR